MSGAWHLLILVIESAYPKITSKNFHVVEELILRFERMMVWAAEICQLHLVELPSQISIIQSRRTVAMVYSREALDLELISSLRDLRVVVLASAMEPDSVRGYIPSF
jgi:hypothetical protein